MVLSRMACVRLLFFLLLATTFLSCKINELDEWRYYEEKGLPSDTALDYSELILKCTDDPFQLHVQFDPDDSATAAIWSSSNPSVATVSETGLVTPLFAGTTEITVRSDSTAGTYSEATCNVTVSPDIQILIQSCEAAQFDHPTGITCDESGNLYVCDTGNHTIRKISPDGYTTTLAGSAESSGSQDGVGTGARFRSPRGITVDSTGNLYVTDSDNHTIRKITPDGTVSTLAGLAYNSGSTDGVGSEARFRDPRGIAVDTTGNIYVADYRNHKIRKITPDRTVTTLAGSMNGQIGYTDGTGIDARFDNPYGIVVDTTGNIYVTDSDNNTIRKITPDATVTTLAGLAKMAGENDGTGSNARFGFLSSITVDHQGNLLVLDDGKSIRKVTPDGIVTTLEVQVNNSINGLAVDDTGAIFFTYTDDNYRYYDGYYIGKMLPDGSAVRIAGDLTDGSRDGAPSRYALDTPGGCVTDSSGNIFLCLGPEVVKITPDNTVRSFTSVGTTQMNPNSLAIDSANTLYVANQDEHIIQKVLADGTVSILAGSRGNSGSTDGPGTSARFKSPKDITIDTAGNLYVADTSNNTIRKITPDGMVSTLAGAAGYTGNSNGSGSAARFNTPYGITLSSDDTLYVADFGNNCIRAITPDGTVGTLYLDTTALYSNSEFRKVKVTQSNHILAISEDYLYLFDAQGACLINEEYSSLFANSGINSSSHEGFTYIHVNDSNRVLIVDTRGQTVYSCKLWRNHQ